MPWDEKVYDCILFDAIPGYRGTWMIKYTRVYFLMPRRGAWMIKYTRVYFFVKISKQWPISMGFFLPKKKVYSAILKRYIARCWDCPCES